MLRFLKNLASSRCLGLLAVASGGRCSLAAVALLVLAPRAAFAADGEVVIPSGGGVVAFTNAAEQTWINNSDGTKDLLLKFLPTDAAHPACFTFPGATQARILMIGGGGGGGGAYYNGCKNNYGAGGGGGAGTMIETNALFGAGYFEVNVGVGGTAGKMSKSSAANYDGGDGSNTVIRLAGVDWPIAYGGGGGGAEKAGHDGGSGGGGSMKGSTAATNLGGQPLDVAQGHAGGAGDLGLYGGGGGGAGGKGADASTTNPVGGKGRQSGITCDYTVAAADYPWYAGGGGGGFSDYSQRSGGAAILGGSGVGGNGGWGGAGIKPTAGAEGTGSGGGGCDGDCNGAKGGSGVVYVRVSAALAGDLKKPVDPDPIKYDGATHQVYPRADAFYEITGQNDVSAVGLHAVWVRPLSEKGIYWEGGSSDPVQVTLLIAEADSVADTVTVTGASVSFFGVHEYKWLDNADGTKDLLLAFTGAGSYTLPGSSQARILAVGGGGGGGGAYYNGCKNNYGGGGGGGAGGLIETNAVFSGGYYQVGVGIGGVGGKMSKSSAGNYDGGDGSNTVIRVGGADMVVAYGGGGGGAEKAGHDGGSGGGGSMKGSTAATNLGGQPLDVAQGHAGGAGDLGLYGGGGGGAGGKGADASTTNPVGGKGRQSGITCDYTVAAADYPWYAGGGGGGFTDYTKKTGGAAILGGSGVGGNGGWGLAGIKPTAGAAGTGSGGGGCDADCNGANGGSGVVYVRISTAMEGEFRKPKSPDPVAYDRNAHTSVVNTAFYTFSGDNVGTDVGTYVATVTLKSGVTWPEGGDDPVDVTLQITNRLVTISGLHIDDWEYKTPVDDTPDPTCTPDPSWAAEVLVYDYAPAGSENWQMSKPTARGDYRVKVRLTHDAEANYKIANPAATVANFKITPILVVYDNLVLRDWMFGTPADETPNPTCTTNRSDVAAVFEYKNRDEGRGTLTEEEWMLAEEGWSLTKPTAVGRYWVRVRAPDFDNYDFDIKYADFEIFPGLGDLFRDWVDIEIKGLSGEAQASYPYVLTLKENDPVGFLHERAGVDGETLAFTDADGNVLGYKVVSWNEGGVSTLTVCLPTLGADAQTIRLYWCVREGKKAPTHAYEPTEPAVPQPACAFGLVNRDGLFVNYWLTLPAMTKYAWASDETPGALQTKGTLAEGPVAMTVINAFTGEPRSAIPTTEVGAFRLTFMPDDPRHVYEPLVTNLDIRISGNIVIDNLRGTTGDETLNGRVLLANDDEAPGHAITNQGYWQTNVVDGVRYTTYWDHGTETHKASKSDGDFPYLLYGINHTLNHINDDTTTNVLWRLKDVLMGNQLRCVDGKPSFHGMRAYLPWSPTAHGITSKAVGEKKIESMGEVGNLLLRNREDAAVYSPCYPDGIGTIYFDVTRGQRDGDADGYQIVVEVATKTSDGEDPTDENSRAKVGDSVFPHLGQIGPAQWIAQKLHPLKRDNNAAAFTLEETTKVLSLTLEKYNSSNNFYRVYVPVNVKGAARFRIRRTSTMSGGGATPYNDMGGFILLDNIVVSYPQMTAKAEPYGLMDRAKEATPRLILGQEAAMTVAYPAVGQKDVYARAKPVREASGLTNINEKALIQQVTMHYRWRYLDQASNDWATVTISPANNFVSDAALKLPADREGDVEFWYETETQMPYYEYYEYAGTKLGLAPSGYSEAVGTITNHISLAATDSLPTGTDGRDWFFRLRPGKSDYEGIRLVVKDEAGVGLGDQTLNAELTGDHVWRCFLKTPTNVTGSVKFRFEAYNLQPSAAAETVATNGVLWKLAAPSVEIGGVGTLEETDESGWTSLVVDGKAGYAMIQVDDRPSVRSFVIVHGDRQDFNRWSDARKTDGKGLFVGQSELGEAGASGTSEKTRQFAAEVTSWQPSVSVDTNYWRESFKPANPSDPTQLPIGEAFAKALTPNRWTAGPGQWAAGYYNDPATGRALQMQGQGYGYLQLTESGRLPRGLKSISFTARLAQNHSFSDVCYWDDVTVSGGKSGFSDYTFVTKGAFDLNKARDFAGAASVSAFAYYRTGVGCYEFRITQKTAVMSGGQPTGPGDTRTLQLYRWAPDANKQMKATPLGAAYDLGLSSMAQTAGETASDVFPMIFISCSNTTDNATVVYAGVSKTAQTPASVTAVESAWVVYTDKSDQRLTAGTFGVTSCGCPARFCNLFWYDKPVSGQTAPAANTLMPVESGTPKWNGSRTDCVLPIRNDKWVLAPDRFEKADHETTSLVGFRARTIPQKLEVYTAPKGTADWGDKPIDTFEVAGFGSSGASATNVVNLYTTDDCSVRIAVGGTVFDPRCDVVIDDVEIEQWRGESFDDTPHDQTYPTGQLSYGLPTNFVFTQAWILSNATDGAGCQLNAKRSLGTVATSVRSPLFDGLEGRGLGLGMIGFEYANAQPNAKLLVQIATNRADITTLRELSKSVAASDWATVTNVDFSAMSETERRHGFLSFYIGLHGVKGLMRVALDPATVDAVKGETDPDRFGAVDILSLACTDEPELDERSWWGWNLRTTDEADKIYLGDQKTGGCPGGGLAFGLNDAIDREVRSDGSGAYERHLPFLQTSQMSANLIGEVTFKARKYSRDDVKTYVTIYGSPGGRLPDRDWAKVATIEVTDDIFRSYTHKIPQGSRYASLRFAVVGVERIRSDEYGNGYMPGSRPEEVGHPPVRVLIDEVTVSESIDARVAFRNVRPFRFGLEHAKEITDILSESEQPLVGESWGVQGEVYAAQLTEEVDLSHAKVRLSWFVGKEPWGYDRWKDSADAQHAWLAESADTEGVYRSSYLTCPAAVVPLVDRAETVQYMLEVIWRTADGKSVITNRMEASDWVKPEWYRGVDYNAELGQDRADRFAGYTILDTVAPHWAWVNEANILGTYDLEANNSDSDYQYVEIAAPAEADLSGWTIRMLEADLVNQAVITNTVASFGNELDGVKRDLLGQASGMVFHVVGSLPTLKSGRISKAKGEIDGTWTFENPSTTFNADGEILWTDAFGIQLVRPSGIVEHEIVLNGYDYWGEGSRYDITNPTNTVNFFNKWMPGAKFFYTGDDNRGQPCSLSVCDSKGESSNVWDNAMIHTPGRINTYADGTPQVLPADHPTPAGDTVIVRCNLGGDGRLLQTVGTAVESDVDQIIVLRKGSETGTNIVYTAAPWYELGTVTTNGAALPASARSALGGNRWKVTVGVNVSNGFTVVANAGVCEKLRKLGVTDDNRYKSAIMDWFEKGVDLYGNPWPDSDGEVYPVAFRDLAFNFVTNLTVTDLYWLDICPTRKDQHLVGGMSEAPKPQPVTLVSPKGMTRLASASYGTEWPGLKSITNREMSVFMMITNTSTGEAWSPYVLRGMQPGYTSWDYATNRTASVWTNGSFKISGILMNGLTSKTNPQNWVPLRWFVFKKDSFFQPTDAECQPPYNHRPFTSEIEIQDPSVRDSPGYDAWGDWVEKYRGGVWPEVFYRWELNERQKMYDIEVMEKTNYLSK